ncbi:MULTISPECIES: CPBP family intramembrane glutamic endopeptidase [Curtobacterium]|jgi:membrane protease YdiL (CAAX protease family)|uniref:CPBP family intramembrane metalloprotease n=2 Tax=Curtobacterium TaxID=2034 RepID=A0A9Q2W545_9MICO|nr:MULTISPECIES: CPBP family intramembrane glutamic endopeptidase [Curtobacterium]MBT1542575.1 CPBP family intramembrane metalloprotease [Curtobacterium flaccumfaciens pv. flaccumfaciens]MBT1609269.1 CPBP family intramembrane metalloprotease [Curtobacterium flaccumfaciens pv. poinsettiae]MCS6564519.1 CPBP family intramembrane metalloprotease [Curtobacterium flaccumfaciens pv. flaccumfaciens]MCU0151632.1 CPBP family intramembrane metalloprotease [Curtobacterium flaccumfaciens pv. poinsettiae]MC
MSRRRTWVEITIVLLLSLGASALYSILQIIDDLSQTTPLGEQSTALNTSSTTVQYVDLARQLLGIAVDLAPVALVCSLLWSTSRPHLGRLGIDRFRAKPDLGGPALIALCIGIPGLALYFAGRALGITVAVDPAALNSYWWTIPVLLLSAIRSGLQEEVIVIGYLYARLGDLGWGRWQMILSTALLRGSYHLYQGFGAFIGNAVMGVVFGWIYTKWGRLLPLVITHALLDAVVFVGYPWVAHAFPQLFA